MQKYGNPVVPGHKIEYLPLNKEDIQRVENEIEKLFELKKFSDSEWGLS